MGHEDLAEDYASLKAAARDAPVGPGVYLMRDEEGRIIYVGKAKALRNRLGSYFARGKDVKTAALLRHMRSIETILVSNEYEALLLENTLIKQHSPKYNINLKDGKTYPVVRITHEEFPRIFRTRHIVEDKSLYFGPFPNVNAVDSMLELVDRLFPLRKCRILKKRESPCMYFHIGRCMAPCCGRIRASDYAVHIESVRKLLSGETEALIRDLSARMTEAAGSLRFERAVQFRDAIKAIEELSKTNTVEDMDGESRDYIAWASEGIFSTFSVFSTRGGRLTGRELFSGRSAAGEVESLETFVAAYYAPDRPPPPRIYLYLPGTGTGQNAGTVLGADAVDAPGIPETEVPPAEQILASLEQWFTGQFGCAPAILAPDEKKHQSALAMARQNCQEDIRRRLKERGAGPALDEMARVLGLRTRPERIEGFDIAQLDGKHPVASLISFKNGVPDRKNYRYFKLRTVIGLVDDFAAMREAVHRRYSRLLREGRELPDLVLIDGGIGQVNAARGVMDELGIDCDIVGLAKRDEELWLPGAAGPIRLSRRSEALKVLQFVRDETHRFATGLNQKLRSRDLSFPTLESVEGIGPKRAAAIMRAYGELEKIAAASPGEIAETCGISANAARAVRAAAKLALEERAERKAALERGSPKRRADRAAALAGEALAEDGFLEAAESEPAYAEDGGKRE